MTSCDAATKTPLLGERARQKSHRLQRSTHHSRKRYFRLKQLDYKRSKVATLLRDWTGLLKEIEQRYLSAEVELELSREEKTVLSTSISRIVAGQELSAVQHSSVIKALGLLLDGSRSNFSSLSEAVEDRLKVLGVSLQDYPDYSSMKVTDFLAQKQEMLKIAPAGSDLQPYNYFELRGLLNCNRDADILKVIQRQSLRRKSIAVLDSLAAHIKALQCDRDEVETLNKIDETERRYTQAKDRLDQEKQSRLR